MESINISLQIGDKIGVGKFRNIRKTITDIKLDDYGQPVIVTDDEKERKAISFRSVSYTHLTLPTNREV